MVRNSGPVIRLWANPNIANTWLANQRFNTNVLATFGTADGTDADLYYDGTDFIIDVNSGDLKVVIAGGDLAFQQATTISTSTGALTLDPTTVLNVTLTANTGSALNISDGAGTTYEIDSRSTTNSVETHYFSRAAVTIASAAAADATLVRFDSYTVTLTGTTQVTGLMDALEFQGMAITDTSAVTVDMATGFRVKAPYNAGSVALTWTSAFRSEVSSGTPVNAAGFYAPTADVGTNRYGVYVEAQSGGTANYGIALAASTQADVYGVTTLTISSGNGAITIAPSAGSLLFTGTLALTGSRVTQSFHTDITSTNAVTVDSWGQSKENIVKYSKRALDIIRETEVIEFSHLLDRDPSGRVKLGVRAESIREPLALVNMDYGHGLGEGPALDTMGLTALNTKAIQEIEEIVGRLERENAEFRALIAERRN